MTKDAIVAELEQLGFTPNEANVYLALIQKGAMTATVIAATTGLARTAVYPTLNSLVDQGLVEAGEGYGSNFSAVPADRALPHLMLERERLTHQIIERISTLEEPAEAVPQELIQVIRSPRAAAERFERLELDAERQIDFFTKPPFFIAAANRASNPAQLKAQRRGVHCRSIYERAALEDAGIKPYLAQWIAAGEEARIYNGELPHKLAIFDRKVVLLPLINAGEQTKTILIRHPQLAEGLSLCFQYVWDRSDPVGPAQRKKVSVKERKNAVPATTRISHNGRRGKPRIIKSLEA
jgi:HTH-type transcriptional regulator, sugar sensing transcriptional regulator